MNHHLSFTDRFHYQPHLETVQEEEKIKFIDVFVMFFLLMISGNPFFVYHYEKFVAASVIIPVYYILNNTHKKITFSTVFIFAFLLGYELMHAIVYSLDYSLTIFKLALVLLLAFASIQIIGSKFVRVLTLCMVIITIISFVFTFLCYIPGINWKLYNMAAEMFPMQKGFKDYVTPTFLIYTFHPQYFAGEFDYVRNAGIFWESGAFAVFLILTLFLRYITRPIVRVSDLFDKTSILLIVAVITTTSTMGFLALMLLLTFFTMKLKTALKYVFLILVMAMSYVSFVSVEFLGNKISQQMEESDERNNRFGAFLMDWEDIKKRPIIGSSRRIEVIYGVKEHNKATRRPNGFSNFFREYGLIYFTAYFVMVYYSFRRVMYYYRGFYKFSFAFFGVILLWILSFSELIFDLPFFKAMIFLGMAYLAQQASDPEEVFVESEIETA
jgi:hypothetical protein